MDSLSDRGNGRSQNSNYSGHSIQDSELYGRVWERRSGNAHSQRSANDSPRSMPHDSDERPLAEPNPALDQLKLLLLAEAERFRRNSSVSMAVVVSVNERTELLVHFTQRN